jgi:hypothetical protein
MNDTLATPSADYREVSLPDREPPARSGAGAPLRVLVISPFSPVPADAGQRKRVSQTLLLLKDIGLSITLLLYAFEGPWAARFQEDVAAQLGREYEFLVLPASRDIGAAPKYGSHHALDEWWDEVLEGYLRRLFHSRHFDIVLVHNVWLSKALTLAPDNALKVIDTHDLFHLRESAYLNNGIVPEFFRIQQADEISGLNRADICWSISMPEALYLADLDKNPRIIYIPYTPHTDGINAHRDKAELRYLNAETVVFGFLGTSHTFNVAGVSALLEELCAVIGETCSPIELVFGGTICDAITRFDDRIHMKKLGWVEDEDAFFEQVDFCVAPVFNGSGFKVKVADIVERGKPALFSQHATEGLSVDRALVAANAREMAQTMSRIAFNRPPLSRYSRLAEKGSCDLTACVAEGVKSFLLMIQEFVVECVIDLREQTGPHQLIAFLSFLSLARGIKDLARVRILLDRPDPAIEAAAAYLPPSVDIDTDWHEDEPEAKAPMRIWWQLGAGRTVPRAVATITDLRFTEDAQVEDIAGKVILSSDQAQKFNGLAAIDWVCLPHFIGTILHDPAARMVIRACGASGGDLPNVETGRDLTIVIADDEQQWALQQLVNRLGDAVVVADLRDGHVVAWLVDALHRTATGRGRIGKLLDGCTGRSVFRPLVLELAIQCKVPVVTSAFGPGGGDISDEKWLERKRIEDYAAFTLVLNEIDAVRGRLRRL